MVQGSVKLSDGSEFRWTLSEGSTPEVYGWVENDYSLIPGTAGWYRTTNPMAAARTVAQDLNLKVEG
jgi:hypothetical protein